MILFGQDFFWTQATPLAEFEPTEEATRAGGRRRGRGYLETGDPDRGPAQGRVGQDGAELAEL